MPKSPQVPDFDEDDFPPETSEADRRKALSLINVDPNDPRTLEEKLAIKYDNRAMLSDKLKKRISTSERIRTLFQQEKFSPLTRLVRLVKIEEAKVEAYNMAVAKGMPQRLLDALPKPDKKFYATLLLQLVKYEVPELKSIEMSGQVEAGIAVHIVHHTPEAKYVEIDALSPPKLVYGGDKTVVSEKSMALKDDDDI